MKALGALEQRISKSGLEKPLIELVRLRASQINGCAYCIDVHSSDALKAGEQTRRLAALSVWHETPFFSDREAVRRGNEFLHKASLLIPAEFAETKTAAGRRRMWRTRQAHTAREQWNNN